MLTRRHILSALMAASLSAAAVFPAAAQPRGPSPHMRTPVVHVQHAQRSISPAEAKSIARSRVRGGEVVDISRSGDTYRVRVIAKNGKVVDVYIDANTGRVKR